MPGGKHRAAYAAGSPDDALNPPVASGCNNSTGFNQSSGWDWSKINPRDERLQRRRGALAGGAQVAEPTDQEGEVMKRSAAAMTMLAALGGCMAPNTAQYPNST